MNPSPHPLRVALGLFILVGGFAFIAWVLWRTLKKSEDPTRLFMRWLATAVVLGLAYFSIEGLAGDGSPVGKIAGVLAAMVFGIVLAIFWVPAIVGKVSDLIGGLYTGGSAPPTPTPVYSIAEAKRKQGLFREAIYVIQAELAKFPTDVTGQMLLAEIQAENLQDLQAATVTVNRFISQPNHGPKNVAFALNSLADWHLKLARDPDAARQCLERIAELLPNTEQAQNAAQRIAHLVTREEMQRRDECAPIPLPKGMTFIGLREDARITPKTELDPEEEAARLAGHLEVHPLDREAREKLAQLYAGHFNRLDLAIREFDQLARLPNQTPREVARWINAIADLQVREGLDYEVIHETLQRLVDQFPGLAPGEMARQRMETIRLELKGKEKGTTVHLGSYEKDLGLKGHRPGTE